MDRCWDCGATFADGDFMYICDGEYWCANCQKIYKAWQED